MDEILSLVQLNTPIALIGCGGIGKTSIALTVLHHNQIREKFGSERRFIRCDEFPTSVVHLLDKLSKVLGAGIKNPTELSPLRQFLSSKPILLVLDNAEVILDPKANDARAIYSVVDELGRFDNISLFLTSRISTIPPSYKRVTVPTLPKEAAGSIFDSIRPVGEWADSDTVDWLLQRLDYHALSVTLLATVAAQNQWDASRLAKEWENRRTGVLQTEHEESLAATIELSLTSPMFTNLGPYARRVLEVIAFFPQGVDEGKLEWVFPTVPDAQKIVDGFNILSLTHKTGGFVTMLAPLRDHLRPKVPLSSLLLVTRNQYFSRLGLMKSGHTPGDPGFDDTRWITTEDINAEHLINISLSPDAASDSEAVWNGCASFLDHIYWHKPRAVILGPQIEGLADDHPTKPRCLSSLANLAYQLGNIAESKRLRLHVIGLLKQRGDIFNATCTLLELADMNRVLGNYREGLTQAEEVLSTFRQSQNRLWEGRCLKVLAFLLNDSGQLDKAAQSAYQAIDLLSKEGDQLYVCKCNRVLGDVLYKSYQYQEAATHLDAAEATASLLGNRHEQFWVGSTMARLLFGKGDHDEAERCIDKMKGHAVELQNHRLLGRAMLLQARLWLAAGKHGAARSEVLLAMEEYEKIGADPGVCRRLIDQIDEQERECS